MTLTWLLLRLLPVAGLLSSPVMFAQSFKCKPEKRAELSSIKAMLYYNDTGKFSENLADNDKFALWNTIIGEGDAAGPSNTLFVVVQTKGFPVAGGCGNDRLMVTIEKAGSAPVRRTVSHLAFGGKQVRSDTNFQGFWVADAGCEKIKITAQVNGQKPVSKIIPFECGE